VVIYVLDTLMWSYGPPVLYVLVTTWCNVITGSALSRMIISTRKAVNAPGGTRRYEPEPGRTTEGAIVDIGGIYTTRSSDWL
jgi:hypothetical protein